ncbi:MAG: S8 family peptidase [Armatimonadota bacterium]|nr:S8 family peptidase [Armatimonadota bacterium]MDR5697382.1 S8 family peptidase [Armatimonadota bacterium]
MIVVFRPGTAPGAAGRDLAARTGAQLVHVYASVFPGAALLPPAGVNHDAFAADPRVRFVAPDRLLRTFQQQLPTGIDRVEADRNPTAAISQKRNGVNVHLAILDTGLDRGHPDLNIAGGYNATTMRRDDWQDRDGHGTHVAGTAAAIDNGFGVVGVAPGAPVWGVKVCKGLICLLSDIIAGIDWTIEQKRNGRVDFAAINMSLGGGGSSDDNCGLTQGDPFHTAVCAAVDAGIVVVVAAGNESADATNVTPAAYPESFTVSAIADFNGKAGGGAAPTCRSDEDDTFANFSNFGPPVDIAAPGVCILSTYVRGGYATLSGTSMATPHVTGAVALYLAANRRPPARDRRGVESIRKAIVDAGIPQTHDCGFAGDPDGLPEPLLFVNAKAFKGDGTCEMADSTTRTLNR